ncbi:AAA family ATPase [Priestia aryabhattai]
MNILFGRKKAYKSYFKIDKNDDFYYVVQLKNYDVCFTKEYTHAQEIVEVMEDLEKSGHLDKLKSGFKWKNFKGLQHLKDEVSPHIYELIRPVLRKYGVPVRNNGNYLTTYDEFTSTVTYKTYKKELVKGKHLENGVAIREENGYYHLENVPSGRIFETMKNENSLREFYYKTKDIIPWHRESVLEMLEEEYQIKVYLDSVKNAISSGKSIPKVDVELLAPLQFKMYGGTDPKKMKAFVSSMKKIDGMVGLKNIKYKIDEFIKAYSVNQTLGKMNIETGGERLHSLFVGPPGAGKTEMVRLMTDLLWSLDMVQTNKFTELTKADLVSSYIGGTEEKTKQKIIEALGGTLFVDEAYMFKGLSNNGEGNDYGKIALDIIMQAMDYYPGNKLVVFFAGYPAQIDEVLEMNDGLPSRFKYRFEFNDYTPAELTEIANGMLVKKGFVTDKIQGSLKNLIESKAKLGAMQGNARDARKLVDEIIEQHKVQLANGYMQYTVISPSAIEVILNKKKIKNTNALDKLLKEGEKELNELIGMESFKEGVQTWKKVVEVGQKRFKQGINMKPPILHMVFKGNPGVGKTTAARKLAKILKGMGVLSSGHFIEVQGKDLVGDHEGHTPKKVDELLKKAKGGILFIDEAYSMVKGKNDKYGSEAVDKLVGAMDGTGANVDFVIILAGYPREMEKFLSTNPGFKSRISEHFIFEDYNVEELIDIFKLEMNNWEFILDHNTLETAKAAITFAKEQNKLENSNGRWISNFVNAINKAMSVRISEEESEELQLVKSVDVKKAFVMM